MADPVPPLTFARVVITDPLISLLDAKARLKVLDAAHDAEIGRTVIEAQNAILDYLTTSADPTWTEATLPHHVRAAVLKMLTHLWVRRGDDPSSEGTPDDQIWTAIDLLLARSRDPGYA